MRKDICPGIGGDQTISQFHLRAKGRGEFFLRDPFEEKKKTSCLQGRGGGAPILEMVEDQMLVPYSSPRGEETVCNQIATEKGGRRSDSRRIKVEGRSVNFPVSRKNAWMER